MALYQHGMSLKALLENPELLNPPRKQDDGKDKNKEAGLDFDGGNLFAGQSAFLGPQLWDKTVSYDENDLKLEFMDLDEFLNENCIPDSVTGSPQQQQQQSPPQLSPSIGIVPAPSQLSPSSPPASPPRALSQLGALLDPTGALALQPQQRSPQLSPLHHMVNPNSLQVSPQRSCPPSPSGSISSNSRDLPPMPNAEGNSSSSETKKRPLKREPPTETAKQVAAADFEPNPADLMLSRLPGEDFDPRCRSFTEEELRPQPLIKKSRKVFVPEDLKDDKYWARRRKNNVAARRSRDARRTKENQIAMRALFLENQADRLQEELDKALAENEKLRARLAKYEPTA